MAESTKDLTEALGDQYTETGKNIRTAMDTTNRLDFIFMFCYSSFFASLFVFLYRINCSKQERAALLLLRTGLLLALLMLVSDIFETRILLRLTASPMPANVDTELAHLHIWTSLKSGAINIAVIMFAGLYASYFRKRIPFFIFAVTYLPGAVLGFMSIFISNYRALIETVASIGAIGWLASAIHAGTVVFDWKKDR
jgi:hypothetical protein